MIMIFLFYYLKVNIFKLRFCYEIVSKINAAKSRNEVLKSRKQKYFPYYYADEWLNGTVVNRISFIKEMNKWICRVQ